jgi:hypothetical protein
MKKLHKSVCLDLPIAKHFSHKNFIYELKPIISILLKENVKFNTLLDYTTKQDVISEDSVVVNPGVNNTYATEYEDEETVDTVDDNMANYDNLSSFLNYINKIKRKRDEELNFVDAVDCESEEECENC